MLKQIDRVMLIAVAVGTLLGWSASALARPIVISQRYENKTDGPVFGMEKIFWGTLWVDKVWSDTFGDCGWDDSVSGFTIVSCRDGVLEPGDWARVVVVVEVPFWGWLSAEVLCTWWMNEFGEFTAYAGGGATTEREAVNARASSVNVRIRHTGAEFDGSSAGPYLGPITADAVYYAVTDELRPHDALTDEHISQLVWQVHPAGGFTLNEYGDQTASYVIDGGLTGKDSIVIRYEVTGNVPGGTQTTDELTYFRVHGPAPTVSGWGVVVIALLVLTAGTVVIRRSRAIAT